MKIAVVDGQGGGIGKAIVERLKAEFGNETLILALGTNSLATSAMLRAGANEGATGENAIAVNAPEMDVITGPIGIIAADSLLGELTPRMAEAIMKSRAQKVLIPLGRCNIHVADVIDRPLPQHIDSAVQMIKHIAREEGK